MKFKQRVVSTYSKGGFFHLLLKSAQVFFREIRNLFYPLFLNILPNKKFHFNGEELKYFYHCYNTTWVNERVVEAPIAINFVKKHKGKRILEIGNVLNYYSPFPHDVVDKYEIAPGVINEDVVDFKPAQKYDLIISVSTMEHVGWDEAPRQPENLLLGFDNLLKNCLADGGKIVATMPLGYNLELDQFLKNGQLKFSQEYFLKRISKNNFWEPAIKDEALKMKYGFPFPNANAVIIGILARQ